MIEIRYELQPTALQMLAASYFAKIAGALAAPFVTILFFSAKENMRPRTRKVILLALAVLQAPILVFLAYQSFAASAAQIKDGAFDWAIVLITAIATAIPLSLKRDQRAQERLPVRI